jgi:hypothetical protein
MKQLAFLVITFLGLGSPSFSQSFGPDKIIESVSTSDQRQVELTTAFNGWIFSAYTTFSAPNNGGITIQKSTDGGLTWTVIDSYSISGVRYESFDIQVVGSDLASLKLFLVGVNHNLSANIFTIFVDEYDAVTGDYLVSPLNLSNTDRVNSVAIASDYRFPAVGVSPFSIGLVYSKHGPVSDSIISLVSLDGGDTFGVRNTIRATGSFSRKVSLDYGRSISASNGRYFAAWEELGNISGRTGHIYTSRNLSTVNGGWLSPVNLDSISSAMINLCRNPRIAMQQNDLDNDSLSVTAVVLVERDFNGDGSDYDILGLYNKRAHFTNFWNRLDIQNTNQNSTAQDIVFEPSDTSFHAVYFDSTSRELRYLTHEFNLLGPSNWTIVASGFNDTPDSTQIPTPRIAYRLGGNGVAVAWIDENPNGNGVAKIDVEGFTSLGLDEADKILTVQIYPNPVQDVLSIKTEVMNAEVFVLDMNGRILKSVRGEGNLFAISVDDLSSGTYLVQVVSNGKSTSQLVLKN